MAAAAIRAADPVVTSNGDRLRFESFSACCGVYARLDLLAGSFGEPALRTGTTNIDLNPPTREALAGVAGGEPLHLCVGLDDVVVTTLDGTSVERRVPLPDRWLKGFAEVQIASAAMAPGLEAYADRVVAATSSELWHELSRATHHHAYDLAPTVHELRGLVGCGRGNACPVGCHPWRLRGTATLTSIR